MAKKRGQDSRIGKPLKRAHATGVPQTEADRAFVRRALREFLERALGEEMARVCQLPYEERRRYVGEMIDYAESRGVKFNKPATGVTR